eukprot:EG_transcript_15530
MASTTAPPRYHSRVAEALDAADGVRDGTYFGRPIVETRGSPVQHVVHRDRYHPSRPYYSATAARVDAADGVVDGTYFGRPIVEAGSVVRRVYGEPIVHTNVYPPSRIEHTSAAAVVVDPTNQAVVQTKAPAPTSASPHPVFRTATAAALDAADGVLDGRYFGRPILEAHGPPTRIAVAAGAVVPTVIPRLPSSSRAVQALDAADGVLDGTYFGRPIVEVAGTQFLRPRYEAVERFDEWPYADPLDVQAVYDTGLRWYYVRPEEHFIRVVESIDQYVPAAGPGHYELHPWLGVTLKWLDDLDQGGRDNVAVVQQVQRGSPAWKAGLRPGDQLEYWGDTKIDSAATWKAKVHLLRIGDVIDFGIHRDRRDQRVTVRVEGTTKHRGSRNRIRSASGAH